MPMDFELTISGLCVLVLRRADGDLSEQPTKLVAADVLCVGSNSGHGHEHITHPKHQPRLSYDPEDLITERVTADLVVDRTGRRTASLDLSGKTINLILRENPHQDISASWGPETQEVPAEEDREEQAWLNWVPPVGDLGFPQLSPVNIAAPGRGASVVLSLPQGTLSARNIVRMVEPPDFIKWRFPATAPRGREQDAKQRAIANEVLFKAEGIAGVTVEVDGKFLTSTRSTGVVQMSISNDLAEVTPDYNDGSRSLQHLEMIGGLAATGTFKEPEAPDEQRTGHPICNQALFIV